VSILSESTNKSTPALLTLPPFGVVSWVGLGEWAEIVEAVFGVVTITVTGGGGLGHLPGLVMLHLDHNSSASMDSVATWLYTIIALLTMQQSAKYKDNFSLHCSLHTPPGTCNSKLHVIQYE